MLLPPGSGSVPTSPPYARAGAFATYSTYGGFVAYFGGVYGNVTYSVTKVYGNGSMGIRVQAMVSQSGEAAPQSLDLNYTDSVDSPRQFPAIPPANLSKLQFEYQGTLAKYSWKGVIEVPGGRFNTTEYIGTAPSGNLTFFWFDRSTGLAIQVSKGGSAMQLAASNVATPEAGQSFLGTYAGAIGLIAVLWVVGGAFFYLLIRRMNRKGALQQPAPAGS